MLPRKGYLEGNNIASHKYWKCFYNLLLLFKETKMIMYEYLYVSKDHKSWPIIHED